MHAAHTHSHSHSTSETDLRCTPSTALQSMYSQFARTHSVIAPPKCFFFLTRACCPNQYPATMAAAVFTHCFPLFYAHRLFLSPSLLLTGDRGIQPRSEPMKAISSACPQLNGPMRRNTKEKAKRDQIIPAYLLPILGHFSTAVLSFFPGAP